MNRNGIKQEKFQQKLQQQPLAKNIVTEQVIRDEYTCSICHNVFEEPHRPVMCSHVFCKACLYNASVNSKTCPCCRQPFEFDQTIFVNQMRNKINSLKFNCENCYAYISLRKYNEHIQMCNGATTYKQDIKIGSNMSSLSSIHSQRYASATGQSKQSRPSIISNRHTFKCPYCLFNNMTTDDLIDHCNEFHEDGMKNVVCPVCVSMPWGNPDQESIDFIVHLNLRHKFEYDNYVDFNLTDEQMFDKAIENSKKEVNYYF